MNSTCASYWTMRIERNAPAKINLTLEVLGRRADGYHEIASVMHTLSLCDTLVMELPNAPVLDAARGEIVVVDPHPPALLSHGVGAGGIDSPSPAARERGLGGEGLLLLFLLASPNEALQRAD